MDLGRYNIFGQKEMALEAAQNNRRLIGIRWWFFILIFGIAATTTYLTSRDGNLLQQYATILALGLAFNGVCYVGVRLNTNSLRFQQFLTVLQLTLDLLIIGIVTFVQGGVEARTTVLYMFPILSAALLFRGSVVMLAAALSGATFVVVVLLHYYVLMPTIPIEQLIVPLVFYPAVFLLLSRIAIYLEHLKSNAVRESAYSSFLSLVGHQLKHPASATVTIIDALDHDQKLSLDKNTRHYIELLKGENENQIRLIDNLLESAPQPRAAYTEDVDVATVLEKSALRLANANERTADLVKRKDSAASAIVSASTGRLALAFGNLFDNALRYSKPGDRVTYGVDIKRSSIVITIRDAGIGMKADDVIRQMQRLSIEGIRGMEAGGHLGGLGLGLYASSRIIQSYGGTLDIHSSEQIGTTVTITLVRKDTHG
jgi:signal transduction histidine kinase